MAMGFKHGASGGGYELNFQVVNKSTQPTDPKENTIWVGTSNLLNCWSYGPKMPLRRSKNKNFASYPPMSKSGTSYGVTFSVNTDTSSADCGKITASGTATGNFYFRHSKESAEDGVFLLPAGTYFMSGCPSGGGSGKYSVQLSTLDPGDLTKSVSNYYDYGSGRSFTLTEDAPCRIGFYIAKGTKLEDITFYFQVEEGSSATSYERGNANGQVWIKSDANSVVSFDGFKRNSKGNNISVCPGEVWLFRNNYGWQNYDQYTKIYRNGAWVDMPTWDGYYFKAGDQRADITGGWTASGWTSNMNMNGQSRVDADSLYVLGQANDMSAVGTVQKVDLTGIKTIKAGVSQNFGAVTLCICDTRNVSNAVASKENTTTGSLDISLDVSSYNGSYYIVLYAAGSQSEATITNVRGE